MSKTLVTKECLRKSSKNIWWQKRRGRGYGTLGHRQINTRRKVPLQVNFFRWRHFALSSVSLIFLRIRSKRRLETMKEPGDLLKSSLHNLWVEPCWSGSEIVFLWQCYSVYTIVYYWSTYTSHLLQTGNTKTTTTIRQFHSLWMGVTWWWSPWCAWCGGCPLLCSACCRNPSRPSPHLSGKRALFI